MAFAIPVLAASFLSPPGGLTSLAGARSPLVGAPNMQMRNAEALKSVDSRSSSVDFAGLATSPVMSSAIAPARAGGINMYGGYGGYGMMGGYGRMGYGGYGGYGGY